MAKKASKGPGALADLSLVDLQIELNRRGRKVQVLERKYTKTLAKLEAIRAEIEAHGGSVTGGGVMLAGRKRARNDSNLVDALAKVLKGKTMSVTDLAEAVQRAGYQTTSKTFRTIVNQALIKHTDTFKKVSRGMYTV